MRFPLNRSESDLESRFVPSRPALPLVAATALIVWLAVLASRPPIGSEVRYVLAAREMVQSGDWVVPHLCHVPYMEKPILLYWAAAAGRLLLGGSNVALRAPSILAGLATVAAAYGFARRLRGPSFALGAAAMVATSGLIAALSAVLMTDGLFAGWLAVSWYALWRHRENPSGRWIWAFWGAVGLAVLTKGLLALGFVGVSVGAYLVLSRRVRDAFAMRPLLGPALIVLIQIPWSVLVYLRDPRLIDFYYVRQNLGAFVSSEVNHDRSLFYYVPWLVAGVFPWSALLVAALPPAVLRIGRDTLARLRTSAAAPVAGPDDLRLYLACIAVPSFGLLTVAGSKLATYLLPILPAVVLLVADQVAAWTQAGRTRFRHAFLVQGVVLAVAAAAVPWYIGRTPANRLGGMDPSHAPLAAALPAVLALGCIAGWFALRRPGSVRGLVFAGAASALVLAGASVAVPVLAPDADGSRMVARMEALRAPTDRVILAGRVAQDQGWARRGVLIPAPALTGLVGGAQLGRQEGGRVVVEPVLRARMEVEVHDPEACALGKALPVGALVIVDRAQLDVPLATFAQDGCQDRPGDHAVEVPVIMNPECFSPHAQEDRCWSGGSQGHVQEASRVARGS